MATPSDSFINVASAGSSPVACFEQTQNSTQVFVQQSALVDPTSGSPSSVDANGNLQTRNNSGTQQTSGVLTATIAYAASSTLTAKSISTGKAGSLQHALVSSSQPTLWTIQTVANNGSATSIATFFTDALKPFDFKAATWNEVTTQVASTSSCALQVVAVNQSTNQSVTNVVYAQFFWAEN